MDLLCDAAYHGVEPTFFTMTPARPADEKIKDAAPSARRLLAINERGERIDIRSYHRLSLRYNALQHARYLQALR